MPEKIQNLNDCFLANVSEQSQILYVLYFRTNNRKEKWSTSVEFRETFTWEPNLFWTHWSCWTNQRQMSSSRRWRVRSWKGSLPWRDLCSCHREDRSERILMMSWSKSSLLLQLMLRIGRKFLQANSKRMSEIRGFFFCFFKILVPWNSVFCILAGEMVDASAVSTAMKEQLIYCTCCMFLPKFMQGEKKFHATFLEWYSINISFSCSIWMSLCYHFAENTHLPDGRRTKDEKLSTEENSNS